jgi:ubiquinone/menaquinone biosynthesis C-methylase UbiE
MPWDGSAQSFDQLHQTPAWRALFQQFIEFAAPDASDLVLEIGSKTGRLAMALSAKAREVQGVEASPEMIGLAEKSVKVARLDNVSFEAGRGDDMPFADGSFDLTCSFLNVYLLPDPTAAVKEMARVTRTGGRLCFVNPSPEMSRGAMERYLKKITPTRLLADGMTALAESAERNKRFSEDDLGDLFAAAGIYEVEVEPALSGLLFLARGRRG